MKKKILLFAAFFITVVCSAATAYGIIIYSDSCNKCVVSNMEHKCGKCGSHMNSVYNKKLTESKNDGYAYYVYTCVKSDCKHQCYGKLKL